MPLPSDPTTGLVRALRGALVGCAGAGMSVLGHVAAGGALPAAARLGVGILAATGVCWWLSDRRWTLTRLAGALLVVQSTLHLGLATAAPHDPASLMLLGHAGASVLVVRLLLCGEDWVWHLLDALSLRVASLQVATGRAIRHRPVTPFHVVVNLDGTSVMLRWRRGPPAALAA